MWKRTPWRVQGYLATFLSTRASLFLQWLLQLAGLAEDITERKRAEETLRESEEHFRGTFENAAVGIAHLDAAGRCLRANEKLCDIIGYTLQDLARQAHR